MPPDDDMLLPWDNVPIREKDGSLELMSDCTDRGRTITKALFRKLAGLAGPM